MEHGTQPLPWRGHTCRSLKDHSAMSNGRPPPNARVRAAGSLVETSYRPIENKDRALPVPPDRLELSRKCLSHS